MFTDSNLEYAIKHLSVNATVSVTNSIRLHALLCFLELI